MLTCQMAGYVGRQVASWTLVRANTSGSYAPGRVSASSSAQPRGGGRLLVSQPERIPCMLSSKDADSAPAAQGGEPVLRIASMGCTLGGEVARVQFNSADSLLDYDVVVLDSDTRVSSFPRDGRGRTPDSAAASRLRRTVS